MLVPQQILNTGVAYPYYGISVTKINRGDLEGFHLTPMLSANIGDRLPEESRLISNSVCTGQIRKTSLEGTKTLNHSNLTSPLTRSILVNTWESFVVASLQVSIELYSSKLVKTELTKEDFKTEQAWDLYQTMTGANNGS